MKKHIKKRVLNAASYTIKNKSTIRETAEELDVSKTTIHDDLTVKLRLVDINLFKEVLSVLKVNKKERGLRGGRATRKLYKEKHLSY